MKLDSSSLTTKRISPLFLLLIVGSLHQLWRTHRSLKQRGLEDALKVTLPLRQSKQPLTDIARSVNWSAKLLPSTTCLSQAITCQARLRQYGHRAQFRIGIRKVGKALDAHAWVEDMDGTLLCPLRDTSPFTVIQTDLGQLKGVSWS